MKTLVTVVALAMLAGCGSSSGTNNEGGSPNDAGNIGTPSDAGSGSDAGTGSDAGSGGYLIGGAILTAGASGLVLATPGEPNLTIPLSYQPAFEFANRVPTGTAYNVTIVSQPVSPACGGICTCAVIDGGVGTVGTSDVTSVRVACAIQLP